MRLLTPHHHLLAMMAVAAAAAVIVACKGDDESVSPDSSTPLPVTFATGANDFDDATDDDTRG